jgi:outer membrane immunogenic protein
MKKLSFAFVLAAGAAMQFAPLVQPASAADLGGSLKDTPYVVVPYWGGFYFGGHAGGAWGNTKLHDQFDYVGDPEHSFNASNTGFIGGAQAGYNVQRGHFVFGVEADIGYLGISASNSAKDLGPSTKKCKGVYGLGDEVPYEGKMCEADAKYSVSSDLYGDLTARFGYATDRTLLYVKGGAAILDADLKSHYDGQNYLSIGGNNAAKSPFDFGHSDTLVGWTIGAGAEYALSPSWSLKAEYQHFDFGKMSSSYKGCYGIPGNYDAWQQAHGYGTCPAANAQYSNHYTSTIDGKTDVSITADAVKVGLNYHIGEGGLK